MMESTITFQRLRVGLLALVAAAVLLAGFAGGAAAANYTALGDSYAAGPLIPNPLLPLGCLKSSNNYAHLAAPGIGLTLRDASCSGAETEDMTNPQNVDPDGPNPPQFNSLDASTTVVSLTIGGNDIGFSEVAESCITANPFSHPCLDKYNAGGVDQLKARIEGGGGPAGDPQSLALGENLRRQLPGDLPGDRVRLLAADAAGVPGRSLPALDRAAAEFDAGDAGGGERRHAGQLVQRQHRPRRLQGHLDPLGRTARADDSRRPDPPEQSGHGRRRQRAPGGGEIVG
jgi:hypothetical protein